jgi:hypothetical protein
VREIKNLTEIDEMGQYEYYSFDYEVDTYGEFVAEVVDGLKSNA